MIPKSRSLNSLPWNSPMRQLFNTVEQFQHTHRIFASAAQIIDLARTRVTSAPISPATSEGLASGRARRARNPQWRGKSRMPNIFSVADVDSVLDRLIFRLTDFVFRWRKPILAHPEVLPILLLAWRQRSFFSSLRKVEIRHFRTGVRRSGRFGKLKPKRNPNRKPRSRRSQKPRPSQSLKDLSPKQRANERGTREPPERFRERVC